jgi:hypothetical protein
LVRHSDRSGPDLRRSPFRVLAVGAILTACAGALARGQDSAFITAAQGITLSALDSTFTGVPFARWLAELGRVPTSAIQWEVNDCGEGGDGRRAPICVEARLELARDTSISVSLIVADLDGAPAPPKIWMVYVRQGQEITVFKTLGALVGYVRSRRP